jgi:hypothetical protein
MNGVGGRLEADAPALALAASADHTDGSPPAVKVEERRSARRRRGEEDEEQKGEGEEEEQVVVSIGGHRVATVTVRWGRDEGQRQGWLLTRVQEAVGLTLRGEKRTCRSRWPCLIAGVA